MHGHRCHPNHSLAYKRIEYICNFAGIRSQLYPCDQCIDQSLTNQHIRIHLFLLVTQQYPTLVLELVYSYLYRRQNSECSCDYKQFPGRGTSQLQFQYQQYKHPPAELHSPHLLSLFDQAQLKQLRHQLCPLQLHNYQLNLHLHQIYPSCLHPPAHSALLLCPNCDQCDKPELADAECLIRTVTVERRRNS